MGSIRFYFGVSSKTHPMNLTLFGVSSILCFGLPVFVILLFKMYRHVSLIALTVYYLLTIVHCLSANSIPPVPDFSNPAEVLYSYAEIPLILASLLFFCHGQRRQQMQKLLLGFIGYEVMISLYYKFSPEASVYIMAPGLFIVVLYTAYLFLRQAKFTVLHGKNVGRVLMLGAILFSYSSYGLVFYTYFIQKQQNIYAAYSLYFVSATVAAILMSVGLFMMRHRIKELQELKIVRRELQMVFGS
jgi:hypothetical protein